MYSIHNNNPTLSRQDFNANLSLSKPNFHSSLNAFNLLLLLLEPSLISSVQLDRLQHCPFQQDLVQVLVGVFLIKL